MKIATGRILDRLPAEEPCLGALFTSYSFDPVFFEEHVLRAVLRLTSDPVEQAERYHHEARRALQETPVVAIVDGAERRPGRRLPFDLLEVTNVVFHPKAVLLLYGEFARLLVGSGNLTFCGYGGNTELFFSVDLNYTDIADTNLLRSFDHHLDQVSKLVRRSGTQLNLFREELTRRIPKSPMDMTASHLALMDSTTDSIINQLIALLPHQCVITSIGLLAPFYERDDTTALDTDELDTTSVFGALAPYINKNTTLDVGIAWDNPQMQPAGHDALEGGFEQIWTRAYGDAGNQRLEHLIPTSLGPSTLNFIDADGRNRRLSLDEVQEAIQQRTMWKQPPPIVFAPRKTIAAATERFASVRHWLHPATLLIDGRPIHRPLHAKLFVVGFRAGKTVGSLVLMGSPNMSRNALLKSSKNGGNVEMAIVFRLDTSVSIKELMPELVYAPPSALHLQERSFPELGINYGLCIEEASHDPRDRKLIITWSPDAVKLPAWRLTYDGQLLSKSDAPPTTSITVDGFILTPATAEIILHTDGREFPIPILVTDLVALPATPTGSTVGLQELLMLLSRRIGTEQTIQLANRQAIGASPDTELNSFFRDGFGPTDVFRAWWCVAEELADSHLSLAGFRLRLEGALGVGAVWACMREAVKSTTLSEAELWFYGAELLRTLAEVDLPLTNDRIAKMSLLNKFRDQVRTDLKTIPFDLEKYPWVSKIISFYKEVHS